MVTTVYWEWGLLLKSIRLGLQLGVFYDGVKIGRILIRHRPWMEAAEDIFYWILSTIGIFRLQLQESNGVTRGFSMAAILLTMLFYHTFIEKLWLLPVEEMLTLVKRRLTYVRKKLRIKIEKHKKVKSEEERHNKAKEKEAKDKAVRAGGRKGRGKEKNPNPKKETESAGNAAGNHGSACHDAGGGSQ